MFNYFDPNFKDAKKLKNYSNMIQKRAVLKLKKRLFLLSQDIFKIAALILLL